MPVVSSCLPDVTLDPGIWATTLGCRAGFALALALELSACNSAARLLGRSACVMLAMMFLNHAKHECGAVRALSAAVGARTYVLQLLLDVDAVLAAGCVSGECRAPLPSEGPLYILRSKREKASKLSAGCPKAVTSDVPSG